MNVMQALTVAALLTNPYPHWANCKVGSWVKIQIDSERAGQKMEIERVVQLVELTDAKAVVENSDQLKVAGKDAPAAPARKQEFPAKAPEVNVKIEKEGDEEIDAGGKKVKCHWVEFTETARGKTTKSKCWLTGEIPGGMAKLEATPEGGPTTKMTAVEWEKK